MNMQQVALIVSGVVIGMAGQSPSVDAEPSGEVFAGQSTPFATSCVCDCEERLTKLEINVAALQTHSPARQATSEPETGAIETATADITPAGSGLASVADSYNGTRWTYPGDIDSHLTGSNHGLSSSQLASLTHAQKERLHSSLHQSGQPKAYATSTPVRAISTRRVSSGCPGGVCPVNRPATVRSSSSQRRGLFGGLFRRNR